MSSSYARSWLHSPTACLNFTTMEDPTRGQLLSLLDPSTTLWRAGDKYAVDSEGAHCNVPGPQTHSPCASHETQCRVSETANHKEPITRSITAYEHPHGPLDLIILSTSSIIADKLVMRAPSAEEADFLPRMWLCILVGKTSGAKAGSRWHYHLYQHGDYYPTLSAKLNNPVYLFCPSNNFLHSAA